jgi:hypothetical protein
MDAETMPEPPPAPKTPLPTRPNGYSSLEGYSSLKRFWDLLRGLHAHGYRLDVPPRTDTDQCRRTIVGIRNERAGGLLDASALIHALQEDDTMTLESFNLSPAAREAITALLGGDKKPISDILSEHYTLEFDLTLGFTAQRELILKAEAKYWPRNELDAPFPLGWPLQAVRLSRDQYRVMLERLAGIPSGR